MPNMESRVTSLEEHRRDRDKYDDRILNLMEEIQKDVHILKIKFEKKASFVGGMAFACTLIGGAVGSIAGIATKKLGLA